MLEIFKPTWMVNTIYSVSPAQLKEQGVRAVFSDMDNTLIAWNNPDGTPELKEWMDSLREAHIPLIVFLIIVRNELGKLLIALTFHLFRDH